VNLYRVICKFGISWNINTSHYTKFLLSPLSDWMYQMVTSINAVVHIIFVNMSAVQHCQVGDKQERRDNMDYVILEFPTYVIICEVKSN
jgi:hypothetical protein